MIRIWDAGGVIEKRTQLFSRRLRTETEAKGAPMRMVRSHSVPVLILPTSIKASFKKAHVCFEQVSQHG